MCSNSALMFGTLVGQLPAHSEAVTPHQQPQTLPSSRVEDFREGKDDVQGYYLNHREGAKVCASDNNIISLPDTAMHYRQQATPRSRTSSTALDQAAHSKRISSSREIHISHPMSNVTAEDTSFQIWMSARPRVASLRDLILTMRVNIKKERERCRSQEELFDSIMDAFMAILDSVTIQGSYMQCKSDLENLSRRMKATKDELKVLREGYRNIEDNLSSQEYQLSKLEDEVYQTIDKQFIEGHYPTWHVQTQSHHTIRPNALGRDDSSPLRDKLYSRIADFHIYLERLTAFEYELREELDERDILRSAGQVKISSDVQFYEQIKGERAKIQQELEESQADIARLKALCIHEGVEFEDVQLPDHHYHVETESFDQSSANSDTEFVPGPKKGSPDIVGKFFNAQERVRKWLKYPTRPQEPSNGESGTSTSERGRQESYSDYSIVRAPSQPRSLRPSSAQSFTYGSAKHMPQWKTGPPPGSALLEALLLDSSSTPLGTSLSAPLGTRQPNSRRKHNTTL